MWQSRSCNVHPQTKKAFNSCTRSHVEYLSFVVNLFKINIQRRKCKHYLFVCVRSDKSHPILIDSFFFKLIEFTFLFAVF